jgi:DNA recombination protein RmuC
MDIIYFVVGIAVGYVVAAVIARLVKKASGAISRDEYEALKNGLNDSASLKIEAKQAEINSLKEHLAVANANNKVLNDKVEQSQTELLRVQKQMQAEFENLANKILEDKSQKFVAINEEKLAGILNPLKEKIQTFEKKVDDTYSNEIREKAALRKELEMMAAANQRMTDEAGKLTRALKGDSKVQGDWGEVQLEMLLEKSGLVRDIHYRKQENFKTEDGANVRPDYIINLPENKNYVIDCKVSLTAYEKFCNTEDEALRNTYLSEHIASITRHIADLGGKTYQNLYNINPPDFVFLFVPIEPALHLALQADPSLFEKTFAKNVVLISASTLLATLRTITFIWKQENQRRNVQEIARESGALYDKFVGFTEDLIGVGKKLSDAQDGYKAAMNKLTDSARKGDTIVGRTERIKALGANTTKSIDQRLLDKASEV